MKNIEKVIKQYEALKLIDKQMISIEKLAMQLTESENIIYFNLSVEDLNLSENAEDALGKLNKPYELALSSLMFSFGGPTKENKKSESIKYKLDTKTTLMCLGVIMQSLNEKRMAITAHLELLQFNQPTHKEM